MLEYFMLSCNCSSGSLKDPPAKPVHSTEGSTDSAEQDDSESKVTEITVRVTCMSNPTPTCQHFFAILSVLLLMLICLFTRQWMFPINLC